MLTESAEPYAPDSALCLVPHESGAGDIMAASLLPILPFSHFVPATGLGQDWPHPGLKWGQVVVGISLHLYRLVQREVTSTVEPFRVNDFYLWIVGRHSIVPPFPASHFFFKSGGSLNKSLLVSNTA